MADLNTMPVFTDAIMGDTTHLDDAEFGSYALLLFVMWRNGAWLPTDQEILRKYARCKPAKWSKRWAVLSPFFYTDETGIRQKKLVETYSKAIERRDKFKENGKRGGEAKALKNNTSPPSEASNRLGDGYTLRPTNLKPESTSHSKKESAPSGAAPRSEKKAAIPKVVADLPQAVQDERKSYYDRAVQILGEKHGGATGTRVYKSYGGDAAAPKSIRDARSLLEKAASANDKMAYIGAVLRKRGQEEATAKGGWDPAF